MSSRIETKKEGGEHPAPVNGGDPGALSGDSVGKIREILFGEQMEGYDERFQQLEQRLGTDLKNLQKSMEQGFDTLRDMIEKRTEAVSEASVHRRQLADALEQLASQLRGDK